MKRQRWSDRLTLRHIAGETQAFMIAVIFIAGNA